MVFCCRDSSRLLLSQALLSSFPAVFYPSITAVEQKNTNPSFSHLFCPALRQMLSDNSCMITSELPRHDHKNHALLTIPVLKRQLCINYTFRKTPVKHMCTYWKKVTHLLERVFLFTATKNHRVRKRAAECVIKYLGNSCDYQQLHGH